MTRELVIGSGLSSTSTTSTVTISANPVTAASVAVADVGGYFNGTTVEAVLAEIATSATGATWYSGEGAPSNSLGANRDFYLDTLNDRYYGPKAYGNWGVSHSFIGNTGPQGPQGPIGITPTVTVGTVTTGASGTNAAVTNTGNSAGAIFNFTIPRGNVGSQGPTGATGATGPTGPANLIILNQFYV